MKKILSILMATIMATMVCISLPVFALEGENVITVDGTVIAGEYFKTENDVLMVPARTVAEAMGFTVGWDNEEKAVTISAPSPLFLVLEYSLEKDKYVYYDKNVRYERRTRTFEQAPVLIDEITYIPAVALTMFDYGYTIANGTLNYENTAIPDKAPGLVSAVSNADTLYTPITILAETEDKKVGTSYDVLAIATPANAETGKYVILKITEKDDKITLNKVLTSGVEAFTSNEPCEWQPVEDYRIKSWYYSMLKKAKNMPEDITTLPLAYIGSQSYGGKTFAVVSLIKNKDTKVEDKYGIVYIFGSPIGTSEYKDTTYFVYFQ